MARPPPSRVRSGWAGTAWQEEHPPALKMTCPFARSGVYAGNAAAGTVAGIVRHQNTKKPAAAARTALQKSRRNIRQSLVTPPPHTASMRDRSADGPDEISVNPGINP